MKLLFSLFLLGSFLLGQTPKTAFEVSGGTESVHPNHVLDFYRELAKAHSEIRIEEAGLSDLGSPIHTIVVSEDGKASPAAMDGKIVVFINNGIHSGESCGIDASQLLVRDILQNNVDILEDITLVIIPVYNVGGHQKFSPYNRINQNGPVNMGFRGNARNYDLNRDFMKMTTKNAATFASIFHSWNPDIFIDNHSTNGADYRHALTYMINETAHTTKALRDFVLKDFKPELEDASMDRGVPAMTYVSLKERDNLKAGIDYFHLAPRYSTGYTDLFNTISILVETHMLKPYNERVSANYKFMQATLETAADKKSDLKEARSAAILATKSMRQHAISWKKDYTKSDKATFLGYNYTMEFNKYAGTKVVKYHHDQEETWEIDIYNHYEPQKTIDVPNAYIVPKQWADVIRRLKANGVQMKPLKEKKTFSVEEYRFARGAKWRQAPFEGKLGLAKLETSTEKREKEFQVGDYVVEMNQAQNKYILEVLEPEARDSFTRWGFFNIVFQQKEYFSPYLFVDKIPELFKMKPELEREFEQFLKDNPQAEKNMFMRLYYLYERSPWYEKHVHMLYPIARVVE